MTNIDRRGFLQGAALAPLAPWLSQSGRGHWLPRGNDRTIIVLELQGGNDGLNTVIPKDDSSYARLRPSLASVRGGAHDIDSGMALHPALRRLHARIQAGRRCGHSRRWL